MSIFEYLPLERVVNKTEPKRGLIFDFVRQAPYASARWKNKIQAVLILSPKISFCKFK